MTTLVRAATLAAFGALLVLSGLAVRNASAHEPHPGLEFSIGVHGVPGCNTRASNVTCTLPAGQTFGVEVGLDALPDDIPSYKGFDLDVEYTGVTASNDASNDDWPDCGFPASFNGDGFVSWGCATGLPPAGPSSYIGRIGTVTFTCSQSGSLALRHGAAEGYTDVVQGVSEDLTQTTTDAEGNNTRETLTITCGQVPVGTPGVVTQGTPGPAGPTPGQAHPDITGRTSTPAQAGPTLEPTAAAEATTVAAALATAQADDEATSTAEAKPPGGTNAGDDDDSNTWLWIVIVIAGVAAVGIAASGYWYVRSRSGNAPPSGGSGADRA